MNPVRAILRPLRTLAVAGLAWFAFLYLVCWLCDRQVGP